MCQCCLRVCARGCMCTCILACPSCYLCGGAVQGYTLLQHPLMMEETQTKGRAFKLARPCLRNFLTPSKMAINFIAVSEIFEAAEDDAGWRTCAGVWQAGHAHVHAHAHVCGRQRACFCVHAKRMLYVPWPCVRMQGC